MATPIHFSYGNANIARFTGRWLLFATSLLLLSFLFFLLALIVYNAYFHPYAQYPGPFWARVSPLYALLHAYRGDLHLDVTRCHIEYGSVVRYSPNRLVFNTPTALRDIYGQGRNTQKSQGYAPHPYFPAVYNTHNCIDKEMHGRKRRIVRQGFAPSAILASEPMILGHVRNLCTALLDEPDALLPFKEHQWSVPRDMGSWTNYFTLDVISDLTYGRPFDLIKKPDLRWLVNAIVAGNRRIYLRFAFPTLFNVKPTRWYSPDKWIFPEMAGERSHFLEISSKYSTERKEAKGEMSKRNDIMSALLAARDPKTGDKLTDSEVWGEAHLMIAAGGDTTSTALASVLFYLSRSQTAYNTLAQEIRTIFPSATSIRQGILLNSCHYLRACLEEAMRLAPPAPGALWREVSAGGANIDGKHIPEGYDVAVCMYAIHHNPDHFPDPYAFKPERFLRQTPPSAPSGGHDYFSRPPTTSSRFSATLSPDTLSPNAVYPAPLPGTTPVPLTPGGTEQPSAFAPFLIGPRSCLAKPLAYLEMSLALAMIMWTMDFEAVDGRGEGKPGSGFMGRERKEEFQIVDMFSSSKEGPVLRFRRRGGGEGV